MTRSHRLLVALTALGTLLGLTAAAPRSAPSEHRRIVDYWTAERIASAVERDVLTITPAGATVDPQARGGKPGGGGGKGGGGGGGCLKKSTCSPTVSIDAPSSGAIVAGDVAVSGTANDQDGTVVSVNVDVSGSAVATSGTTSWSATWDSTSVVDGDYTITATATDDSGRTGSSSVTVTVDNVADPVDPTPTVTGASWTGDASGNARTTTGRVLFTLGTTDYVCSGTLVDDNPDDAFRPDVVLSAGHCVWDASTGFATNWMFFPDYESNKTFTCAQASYGCWTADALVTSTEWHASEDFDHDAAFAHLRPGGKDGSTPITAAIGVSQGLASGYLGDYVTDFGYPAASPYNGQTLIYCAGQTEADPYNSGGNTHGLLCDMTGGSSGGSWLLGFDYGTELGAAVSLNSYKYRVPWDTGRMYGPIFGAWTMDIYNAALSASANGWA